MHGRVLRVLHAAVDLEQEARQGVEGEERRVRQQELEEADLLRVSGGVPGVDGAQVVANVREEGRTKPGESWRKPMMKVFRRKK